MRAVIQRVLSSSVEVDSITIGQIGSGINVLLGISKTDTEDDIKYIKDKILNLRIFHDEQGKLNKSINEVGGEILIVSQFTLYGDCRKGRRPSFVEALGGKEAEEIYNKFVESVRETGIKVETGKFGADMKVSIVNDGPVTILLDSTKNF